MREVGQWDVARFRIIDLTLALGMAFEWATQVLHISLYSSAGGSSGWQALPTKKASSSSVPFKSAISRGGGSRRKCVFSTLQIFVICLSGVASLHSIEPE